MLETHPFPPFAPTNAKVLVLGTFPPKANRWSMEFYYPNYINDFWRIMGLLYFNDKDHFVDLERRTFRLEAIKELLNTVGIAMNDTGVRVHRLRDNASDKYLEIVEHIDLDGILSRIPECTDIATTGEKAAGIIASITSTEVPKMGEYVRGTTPAGRPLRIWRMPSTSRAYPLALDKKAAFYGRLLRKAGILK